MPYRVELTRLAEQDALDVADRIASDSREAAVRWFRGLEATIASLEESPHRFAAIVESPALDRTYRSVHHYSHRVIYRVDEEAQVVYVVRIYHGARKPLTRSVLE